MAVSGERPEPFLIEPWDRHNQALVANVHPEDWHNPEPAGRYNLVVIGAGTAGLVTAAGAAGLGARVALVERELMGGDCLNVGCVPSKGLIRAARAVADVNGAGEYGVRVPPGVTVDFAAVMERMRAAARGDQPDRRGRALSRSRRRRVLRRRPLRGARCRRGRGPDTSLPQGGDRHRRPRRGAAHPRTRRGRVSHERDGLLLDRAPPPARRDRRRPDRLRAGPGLRALRRRGVPAPGRGRRS